MKVREEWKGAKEDGVTGKDCSRERSEQQLLSPFLVPPILFLDEPVPKLLCNIYLLVLFQDVDHTWL